MIRPLAARISNLNWPSACKQGQGDRYQQGTGLSAMYGMDAEPTAKFGRILLARRMVEQGVRFVHLYNSDWDGHAENDRLHRTNAAKTDLPIAGLIGDLKQRGLLESTLVVCVGEFGRTPMMQGKKAAITTRTASRPGWPAAAFKAARSSEPPTKSDFAPCRTESTPMICMLRC
ncbi:MAG: DUF1501 domain-containing protein [Terriglobia bacterium]